ncbi:hypothetical protein BKA63DRAFT_442312 [Paraphoma chrysanthemicola]|nr:hypothetical protein BKA63DRAFT_442312 [Paraphoma chrysanthemicola]
MESNQTAARAAKRFLEDRIRNDWAYPDVPQAWSASDEEVRHAQDFRERYYGESESSDSNKEEETGPYKFDTPDSIGNAIAQTQEARRKRRRERIEAEVEENEGLRIWVHRRDVWTGATSVRKYGSRQSTAPSASHSQSLPDVVLDTFDIVPVAPRLLDTNPIRASITPKAYSDIFQKIVVSSRTPSVPINLADMTKALVQGWKQTDEWPPRAGLVDPLIGKKRGVSAAAIDGNHGGFMERHPHLEKGVDSVKRILHLNGNHHGPELPEGGKTG